VYYKFTSCLEPIKHLISQRGIAAHIACWKNPPSAISVMLLHIWLFPI